MNDGTSVPARRTAVYRLFDADDNLLYVGITYDLGRRWIQHSQTQSWWDAVACQKVKWYPSRREAEVVERTAIKTEKPKHNITYGDPDHLMSDTEQFYCEWNKRAISLTAHPDGSSMSAYSLDAPSVLAPGTYKISFAYDPDNDGDGELPDYVRMTSLEQLEADDSFAAEYGSRCLRPAIREDEPPRTDCACYRHEQAQ